MAVQAQYPSNILLLNRNIVQDSNDYSLQRQPDGGGGYIDQSHMLFNNNNEGLNTRKRSRDIEETIPTTTINNNLSNFSVQNHQQRNQNQLIDISQLQNHHYQQPNVVSTGLKLSFDDQNQQHQQRQRPNKVFSLLFEDFAFQYKQQSDELFYFLHSQGEQLRRMLADKRQRHYHALLGATQEAVSQHIREKEVELEKVARQNAELEAQTAQLTIEAQEWQAKAQAQEAQIISLQAQLQQVMVGPTNNKEESGVGDVEDAQSTYVDNVSQERVGSVSPTCKVCRIRIAIVVLLPCRHLCVCRDCDKVVQTCPLCFSLRNGSVEVYLT